MNEIQERYKEFVTKAVDRNKEVVKGHRATSAMVAANGNMMRGQIELAVIAGWVAVHLAYDGKIGSFWTLLVAVVALGMNQYQFEWESRAIRNIANEVDVHCKKDDIPQIQPESEKKYERWGWLLDFGNNALLILAVLMFIYDIGGWSFILNIFHN